MNLQLEIIKNRLVFNDFRRSGDRLHCQRLSKKQSINEIETRLYICDRLFNDLGSEGGRLGGLGSLSGALWGASGPSWARLGRLVGSLGAQGMKIVGGIGFLDTPWGRPGGVFG